MKLNPELESVELLAKIILIRKKKLSLLIKWKN